MAERAALVSSSLTAAGARDDAQLVCTAVRGDEVLGYVVVDSTVAGRSRGGLRMLPDVDEAEMRGLARAMTLKYNFLGLPQGGAKAGVRGDPEAPEAERRERLATFARAIAPLLRSGVYTPDTDMGTTSADIRYLLGIAGAPAPRHDARAGQSGYYTALTVFTAAREAMRLVGSELGGRTVAIEGFGSVGSPLARFFNTAGARVVAVSTSQGALYNPRGLDVPRLAALAAESRSHAVELYPDADRIDRAALVELPVDILCPCARHNSIRADNVCRVQARVLCPGANNPITPDAERVLFERGTVCVPDFIANSGGVLGGTMAFASVPDDRIEAFVSKEFGARVSWLLGEAERRQVLPREVAESIALSRLEDRRRNGAPSLAGRLLELGLGLYRRGWVPAPLVGRLSLPYFRRSLG